MKLTVQVVLHADDDTETVVREAFTLQREEPLAGDTLGLQLAEAKDLLAAVQDTLVSHQVSTALSSQVGCPDCGAARRHKDKHTIVVRSLFGVLRLSSPRWWHCGCQPRVNKNIQPSRDVAARTDHAGTVLFAGALRRAGLLRSGSCQVK
jgi:hypothetical protein